MPSKRLPDMETPHGSDSALPGPWRLRHITEGAGERDLGSRARPELVTASASWTGGGGVGVCPRYLSGWESALWSQHIGNKGEIRVR